MKTSRFFLVILIIAAAVWAAVNIFFESVPNVSVTKIKAQSFVPYLSLSGTIESSDYKVISETDAVISQVLVQKGDMVSKGQTICTIDTNATHAMAQFSGNQMITTDEIFSRQSGRVVSVGVKSGEIIGEGETVVTIEGENSMQVTVLVGESSISDVEIGQKAVVIGNGFKDRTYQATVSKIGETAKKVTLGSTKIVAVEVCLTIDEPDDNLKSGFTAKVKIFTDEATQICVVPYAAVLQDDLGEYVYLYKQEKAVRTAVTTGHELDSGYEILSGVVEGDIVITSPQSVIKSGTAVTVIKGAE